MITVEQLMKHLQENYEPTQLIGYTMWSEIDVFLAFQQYDYNDIIPAIAEFPTFEKSHPVEYYVFKNVIAPAVLDYCSEGGIREYSDIIDHYENYLSYDDDFKSDVINAVVAYEEN